MYSTAPAVSAVTCGAAQLAQPELGISSVLCPAFKACFASDLEQKESLLGSQELLGYSAAKTPEQRTFTTQALPPLLDPEAIIPYL